MTNLTPEQATELMRTAASSMVDYMMKHAIVPTDRFQFIMELADAYDKALWKRTCQILTVAERAQLEGFLSLALEEWQQRNAKVELDTLQSAMWIH